MSLKKKQTIKLKNVCFNPKRHNCFMYDLENLRITVEQLCSEFEGMNMDIFEWKISTRMMGGQRSPKRCPWCQKDNDKFVSHIWSLHRKKLLDFHILKFQDALYKELLKKVKQNKENYFSHAVLFGSTCQYCQSPSIPKREGMCSLPESARNKMRSLQILGFNCKDLKPELLKNKLMGGIIYRNAKEE